MIFVLAFLRMPGPCRRGWDSVPTKSSTVWLIPQTLEFRLRAVRKSCTTSGANAGESSKNQHSSSTVMLGRPVFPVARDAIAVATIMPIAVQAHRGRSVEEIRIDATLPSPRAQFDRGKTRFIHDALHLLGVPPIGQFLTQVIEGWDWARIADCAP